VTIAARPGSGWGGAIVASCGSGVLAIGLADALSIGGSGAALPMFWLGMLLLFGPATWRLLGERRGSHDDERLLIVLLLAVALFLVKVMVSPLSLTLPDEFSHLRTLIDVLRSGHLFADNPLLQISSVYPGLEAASAAAILSSRIGAFPIALGVIAIARVMTILAVFLLALRVSQSNRVAGVACVIYAANPSFLFFDTAYAYESLALPLALVAIWATVRWVDRDGRSAADGLVAFTAIAATAVTHHLTSVVLLVFLATWAIIAALRDRRVRPVLPIAVAALLSLACSALWLVVAGTLALRYLSTIVGGGVQELIGILFGAGEAKQLFASHAGFASPLPEIVTAYAAVGLLVLALPLILWHAVRGRRPTPFVITLGLLALLYPASLALRFTASGAETSQRASEFVFVALGILGADWLVGRRRALGRPARPVAFVAILTVVAGGIITGVPPIGRLPGPYHVAAEQRSFEPEGEATSTWVLATLGPDNLLVADRTNAKLLGSLGEQYPVTAANRHLATAFAMLDVTLTPADVDVLRRGGIRYVVVDLRLSRDIPEYSYLFEQAEPNAGNHTAPAPLAALQKWDSLPDVTRIYDSGDILIYDIRGFLDAGA